MVETLLGRNYLLGKTSSSKLGKSDKLIPLPQQSEADQCPRRTDRDQQPIKTPTLKPKSQE